MFVRKTVAAAGALLALLAGAGPANAAQSEANRPAGSARAARLPAAASRTGTPSPALAAKLAGATWVTVGKMLIAFPKGVPVQVSPAMQKRYGTPRVVSAPAAVRPNGAMQAASACPESGDACYGPYYMLQQYSGDAVDAADGSAPTLVGQVANDTHQQWFFMATGGGYYVIVNDWYGKVIMAYRDVTPGAMVFLGLYDAGDAAQVWYIDSNGEYHNGWTEQCFDGDPNAETTYQWTCDGNDTHEMWTL